MALGVSTLFSTGDLAAEDRAPKGFAALHYDLKVGERTVFVHTSAFPDAVDSFLEAYREWVPFLNEAFPETPMGDLDPVALGKTMGIDRLAGVGFVSDTLGQGRFQNRSLWRFDGGPAGLFDVFPMEPRPLTLGARAPQNSLFTFEGHFDLSSVRDALLSILSQTGLNREKEELEAVLEASYFQYWIETPPSYDDLFFDSPVTLELALVPHSSGEMASMNFPFSLLEFPVMDFYASLRSEGLAALLVEAEALLSGDIVKTETIEGGVRFFLEAYPVGDESNHAMIVEILTEKTALKLYSSVWLWEAMNKAPAKGAASYRQAAVGLPETGHVQLYLSPHLLGQVKRLYNEFIAEDPESVLAAAPVRKLMEENLSQPTGLAWIAGRRDEDLFRHGNSFSSHRHMTTSALLAPPTALIAYLGGQLREVKRTSENVQILDNLRMVGMGYQTYVLETMRSPSLQDIFDYMEWRPTIVRGEVYPDFDFPTRVEWVYEIRCSEGVVFKLDHTGRVWMEE